MRTSADTAALYEALSKAQGEFEAAKKTSKNPFYGSKYADLAAVIDATRPALSRHGLCVIQSPFADLEKKTVTVTTRIAHSSGQFMEDELSLPAFSVDKQGNVRFDAQTIGIAITYGRRYPYQAIVGLAAEDDDGNGIKHETQDAKPEPEKKGKKAKQEVLPPEKEEVNMKEHRLMTAAERMSLLFDQAYAVKADNETIKKAISAVTGQTSTKMVHLDEVEPILKKVVEFMNQDSEGGVPEIFKEEADMIDRATTD